jgi:hypothetical protein
MIKGRDWRAVPPLNRGLKAMVGVAACGIRDVGRAGLQLGLIAVIAACAATPKPGSLPVDPTPIAQIDEPIGGSASVVYAPVGCPAAGQERCAVRSDLVAGHMP